VNHHTEPGAIRADTVLESLVMANGFTADEALSSCNKTT
jgi:hypothetical protein